jgi:AcrR family transcriptional regulator
MIRQSFEPPSTELEVSSTTIRAIASAIRGVVYRKLRAGEIEELQSLVEEMVEWALDCQQADGEVVTLAAGAAAEPRDQPTPGPEPDDLDWREPPDSPRSRAALTQRERIVRAVGQLVAENGYQTLSIPKISATAGTSNQTFYEHFNNKLEAFLTVFDVSVSAGLLAASEAFEAAGDTPTAIGAAIRALLEHIAADELFARIAFFDVLTAGPMALDRADAALDSFTSFLRPRAGSQGVDVAVPDTLLQAVGCGTWSVIQHEIAAGRRASLPDLGPELARVVLSPLPAH